MTTFKTIGCRFQDQGTRATTYYYLTDDMSIEVGDYCVVLGGNGEPSLVIVNDAYAVDPMGKATKVIIQKVNMSEYLVKVKLIAERAAKMKRLEEISKEVVKKEKFKLLAAHSEEAKQLLADLGIKASDEAQDEDVK